MNGVRDYHFTEERPWGGFTILLETPTYKVKQLVIFPGQRFSYQSHTKRGEHWFIVGGEAQVTLNGKESLLKTGESVDAPVGTKHRIANRGSDDCIVIEIQTGNYFGEDDVVRFEDDYHRI